MTPTLPKGYYDPALTREDGICLFCGKEERPVDLHRMSCDACHAFISEGNNRFYADINFFRFGALLAARQMGFRGEHVRAIARDVEAQRKALWGR